MRSRGWGWGHGVCPCLVRRSAADRALLRRLHVVAIVNCADRRTLPDAFPDDRELAYFHCDLADAPTVSLTSAQGGRGPVPPVEHTNSLLAPQRALLPP